MSQNVLEFLAKIKSLGIDVKLGDEDQLKIKAPRGVFSPELKTEFVAQKPAIIAFFKSAQKGQNEDEPEIETLGHDGPFPLSLSQERLWFIEKLGTGGAAYNMPVVWLLSGAVTRDQVEHAWRTVLDRHRILWTRFEEINDQPVQFQSPTNEFALEYLDLSEFGDILAKKRLNQLIQDEVASVFNLAEPPFRVRLIRTQEEQHTMMVNSHHILSDGWSQGLIYRDFTALLHQTITGNPISLPEPSLQYGDFAHWQRQRVSNEKVEEQLSYWETKLARAPVLDITTDHPRPRQQTLIGETHDFYLPKATSEKIEELRNQYGATGFMVYCGVFAALLSKFSGQEDICIGTPVANRKSAQIQDLVGFFVNNLVLRMALDEDPNLSELIQRARSECLSAFSHQDVPFEQVVARLQLERDMSRSPLFQILFSLDNSEPTEQGLLGITETLVMESRPFGFPVAKYDLSLYLATDQKGLKGSLNYNRDLFERKTVERMAKQYANLLTHWADHPEVPLSKVPFLTEEDQTLIDRGPSSPQTFPENLLHHQFSAIAQQFPERVAVRDGQDDLTFTSLEQHANQLAHFLIAQGIRPEDRIGICLARSSNILVAMLAVIKAGAVYVPLDPTHPQERRNFILNDAGIKLLITEDQAEADGAGCESLLLTDMDLSNLPTGTPQLASHPDQAAYVIYTSGSTGTPKGSVLTHANVLRLLSSCQHAFAFDAEDVWTFFHSFAFDFSVWEIWGPLTTGGRLVVVSYETSRDPDAFRNLVAKEKVTILNQTPSAFQQFAAVELGQSHWRDKLSLRLVIFGGEALNAGSLMPWFERFGDESPQLINMYGITETCVHVTHCRVRQIDSEGDRASLIGVPLDDLSLNIVDRHLQHSGIGIAGELVVAGPGLARAYLHRPTLTAARFVPNPFTAQAGDRLYRSGDLGRFRADGSIEFLGRIDHQVKIRGFRIELGEIENRLLGHPHIAEATVQTWVNPKGDGQPQLVAYFVSSSAEAPMAAELQDFLRIHLPDYMVPALVIDLPRLPLTANGKLDRKALPEPQLTTDAVSFVEPVGDIEIGLAAIWATLLGRERISRHDHFFQLGGHSLLATQVFSRIRETFNVQLPLKTIFESPTLEAFAHAIGTANIDEQAASPIHTVSRQEQVPLSFAQERLWFLDRFTPNLVAYHMPLAYRINGPCDPQIMQRSLDTLAARHESLRTIFPEKDGEPEQIILDAGSATFQFIDLSHQPDADMNTELGQEAIRPFDLATGPLFRTNLYRLAPDTHLLLLCMHHIVSDAWSMKILLSELLTVYQALQVAQEPPLQPLLCQYADFAVWQREWLSGANLQFQLDFWRQQLAGLPPQLDLPIDKPRPSRQTYNGDSIPFGIPPEHAKALRDIAEEAGASLFMVLNAAFNVLLGRYSGQQDFAVGTVIANRNRSEIEPLIGFFVNTLVMRADLSGAPSFRQSVARSRDVALSAYDHQDIPFETLVEHLKPERDLSRTPFFQVLFTLENTGLSSATDSNEETVDQEGMALTPQDFEQNIAKFDLSLYMVESGDSLGAALNYNTDLFEQATVVRMAKHFIMLLDSMVRQPDKPVSEHSMLDGEERQSVTVDWQPPEGEFYPPTTLTAAFQTQVQAHPQRVAVSDGDHHHTYKALDERSHAIATWLHSQGVQAETRIAICMERSLGLVEAMLGVVKAGAVYVPLDPSHPRDRREYILEDAGVSMIIADETTAQELGDGLPCPVWRIEQMQPKTNDQSFEINLTADHAAYIIYTSGSTGKPKGSVLTHANVSRLIQTCRDTFSFDETDIWSFFHSFAFDFSVWELWAPLTTGGQCLVVPHWVSRDPAAFHELICREGVTVLNQTPSAFSLFLNTEMTKPAQPEPALKLVIFGGEALHAAMLLPWFERYGEWATQFINMYGITETCVHVTSEELTEDHTLNGDSVIGQPLPDLGLFVLDPFLRPCGIGIAGELAVSGPGLARAYLNRPALTAERFVPNPFGQKPGERLYRSGDLGRFRDDGRVVYLGRLDHQVKIRGFRIELGEIEHQLRACKHVNDALVITRPFQGDTRLIGYLLGQDDQTVPKEELRNQLLRHLPGYMVPDFFVWLDSFPLNANGKLDRKVLPLPELEVESQELIPPQTETEQYLAEVFCELLECEAIGIRQDLFHLGAHSLLIARAVARINKHFQLELPVAIVFEYPTLTQLASFIDVTLDTTQDNADGEDDFADDELI